MLAKRADADVQTEIADESAVDADADEDEQLEADKLFHLLQNKRRRGVIRYLQDEEGTVRMRDIAEQVAAWEHDTSVAHLSSDQRQRVYIPLYQNHLPKLDEEGVIDYNQSRGKVEKTEHAEELESYLVETGSESSDEDESTDEDADWENAYLGIGGLNATLLLGTVLNVSVLGSLSGLLAAGIILSTFMSVTVLQSVF